MTSNPLLAVGGGPVREEAQPVRRRQDLQRCQEENLRLDATGGIISDLSFFFWFNIEMKIVVKIDIIKVDYHCSIQIPKLEELISKGHMKKMTGR